MAGLCTARVLADAFERVTVVERDPLPQKPTVRRSVPQAGHTHVLQEAGRATLTDLFPGFVEALLSAGGVVLDGTRDVKWYDEGGFTTEGPRRIPVYSATRPLYEHVVRQYVADLDGVQLRPDCQVTTYLTDERATSVEGVALEPAEGKSTDLPADLVVDTTGRTSRTPSWLETHGYRSPPVDEIRIDVAYSTTFIERPDGDRRGIYAVPSAPRTRGGTLLPVEDGRWQVTLIGMHGDHPPTDPGDFVEYASTLPVSHHERLLTEQPRTTDEIAFHPFPSSIRRHYETLERFPDGLIVLGDAIASFNPIYGQGMSVAALEALELHHALATGGREDLALRFFDRIEKTVDLAWIMAAGADLQFQDTEGPRPHGSDVLNWYLSRLTRKTHTDGVLCESFVRVQMMERPLRSLLRPGVVWRVLKPTG